MNTSPRPRHAFTLVELLVVITIIGILAGLITAAAMHSRGAAKRAVIKMEIEQLAMALEHYKTEYGAYPPDFFGLQFDPGSHIFKEARRAVLRHLRKRFPRYNLPAGEDAAWTKFSRDLSTYNIVASQLDPASALVFWLGGLPADSTSMAPAGVHQDPTDPFKQGNPRTKPFFEFNTERYVPYEENPFDSSLTRYLRFYPAGSSVIGNQSTKQGLREGQAPYVYFRSQKSSASANRYEYAYTDVADLTKAKIIPACYVHGSPEKKEANENVAVPYLDGPPASNTLTSLQNPNTVRHWRNLQKFQIICAGLDGHFGNTTEDPSSDVDLHRFRCSRSGNNFSEGGQDFDNLTNFAEGTLEDEMQ